jgi:hypothetical protein
MSNPVWIVVCNGPADPGGTTLGAQCPVANRVLVQTTWEILTTPHTVSPFVLSVADGATLSMLIVGVWVSAWAFKSMMRVVNQSHDAE